MRTSESTHPSNINPNLYHLSHSILLRPSDSLSEEVHVPLSRIHCTLHLLFAWVVFSYVYLFGGGSSMCYKANVKQRVTYGVGSLFYHVGPREQEQS